MIATRGRSCQRLRPGSLGRPIRFRVADDNYSGRRVASFPNATHRPHKGATASPVRFAAVAISNGRQGPPLSKGRSSGGHSRTVRVLRECSSVYASNPQGPQFTGIRTLRVVAVRASRLARRCCGAEFSPKQACAGIVGRGAGILAGAGNRASLWDVVRGRLLIYSSNILKYKYLNRKKWRPQRDLNPRCRRERAVS